MSQRQKKTYISCHGWVLLNKPYELGSTTAVSKVRRLLGVKKAGHAGTLDPLATGVLPIAVGEGTKLIPFIQDGIKTYQFTVKWGVETSTLDKEGEIVKTSAVQPTAEKIQEILSGFQGDIQQKPPLYAAIRINGKRAYDIARSGGDVEMPLRAVFIERLSLCAARDGEADFEVVCGKGTYVRSLARDMAYKLGTVGYVTRLHRSRVGPFSESQAISLEKLGELMHKGGCNSAVKDLRLGLDDIPAIILNDLQLERLYQGQRLKLDEEQVPTVSKDAVYLQCCSEAGAFKGIGLFKVATGVLHPHRLLLLDR
ncbi:tRNA pseudouridine(55) synthase TruB [Alphaproteobacteria bacterium]|nr:tRNA pseudouridine(55) synthase TruB [Alphaproteobacteria bacterium]